MLEESEAQTPTFDDTRQRMQRVWLESHGSEEWVLWAGIFGSIVRGRAHAKSDVDVIVVMKDGKTGQPPWLDEGKTSSLNLVGMIWLGGR